MRQAYAAGTQFSLFFGAEAQERFRDAPTQLLDLKIRAKDTEAAPTCSSCGGAHLSCDILDQG